ncbi:MAG: hypothetical protein M1838_005824 [Thelocarpon superellum]|nr:MAG: hypothetical protein M1838_005824 [Thelocarpon superellum]
MADLDADLLALAGDSSDEQEEQQPPHAAEGKSASPPSAKSASPEPPRRRPSPEYAGVAKKRTAKPAGATRRGAKKRDREEWEEGEASSAVSSPSSLRSASMSESESDTDPMESNARGSKYPLEGRFTSEADRAEIMALPEIKREEILAERATLVEREQQNRMLVQLLRDKERKETREADKKKRKASNVEPDESHRKSARQKTTLGGRKLGEASASLEEYKRQREQRGLHNEQRRREHDAKAADGRRDDRHSDPDADADAESDVSWDHRRRDRRSVSGSARDDVPTTLHDFEKAKVGRSGFAKVCFYPGFEEAITGCFVRISIGVDKATGENIYRLAQIKRFTEGKPYAVQTENGKTFVTNQYLFAAHGKAEREWPFIVCSNAPVTAAELERYRKTCAVESVALPSKRTLDDKVQDINQLLNRSWTEAELQQKLRRSGVLATKEAPLERHAINNRRKEAVARGDDAAIALCDAELVALEGPKLAFGTSLSGTPTASKTTKGLSQQERLAALNRANRRANAADIRKAQLAEKRAEAEAQAAVARGEALANPFARVKTRAKVMHDVHADKLAPPKRASPPPDDLFDSERSGAVTPLSVGEGNTPKPAGTPRRSMTPLAAKAGLGETKGGIPMIRSRNMDDEIIAAMDLGIDVDL